MQPQRKSVRVLLVLLVLHGTIGLVKAQACYNTGWNFEDTKCNDQTVEIYHDVDEDQSVRLCCDPNDEDFKDYKYTATACRVTSCGSAATPDLCLTFDDRFVEGSKLEYEEILRVPCAKGTRGQGMAGYCCVRNSTEAKLASQLGAEQNEFPHMAKLKLPGACGGTIYNKRFVVTAAHCIVDKDTKAVGDESEMQVILGTNIADVDAKEYIYGVKRAIPHPGYTYLPGNEKYNGKIVNDIALLELDRDIQFGPKVKSLEIAPKGFKPMNYANQAVIVGWGTTDTMQLSVHLQKANFQIRDDRICFVDESANWNNYGQMTDQLLCVGGVIQGKWSPTAGGGDSGGPAICRGADGKAILCGVTSFGGSDQDCLLNNDEEHCPPSVYAEVAFFHQWIKDNAGKQDPSTFYKPYLYGQPIPRGKYEHQVQVISADGKPCGGTAIAQDVVVTSAHCVLTDNGKGRKGVKVVTQKGKSIGLKGVAALPGFKRMGKPVSIESQGNRVLRTDNYYKNDLALVKLKEKMDIAPGKLAKLPPSDEPSSDIAYELSRSRNASKSNQLMQREFQILDKTDCQKRLDRMARDYGEIKVDKILLCGVETYSGGSQCDRDLGGGLMCEGPGEKNILCGVQVFRLCEFSIPNGFVNVGMFKDWINHAMKQL